LKEGHTFITCPTQVPTDKDSDDSKTKSCEEIMPLPMIRECLKLQCNEDSNNIVDGLLSAIGIRSTRTKFEQNMMSKLQEIQLMVNANKIETTLEVQNCKKCECVLFRYKAEHCSRLKSVCPVCTHDANHRIVASLGGGVSTEKTKEKLLSDKTPVEEKKTEETDVGVKHYFCWACASDWGEKACTSKDCVSHTRAEVIETLVGCEVKKIGSVESVPSIRACPECGQMINHIDCCKHIHCKRCNTQYCFVCLKRYINGKGWQCGSSSEVCPIHPVQTDETLPSGSRSTFNLYDTLK
jgi:hypothetical protein